MTITINRVYTRSGDDGKTALVGGKRVSKSSARVTAYGDIDELNSFLGLAKCACDSNPKIGDKEFDELKLLIENLQQQLFDLGSLLATPSGETYQGMWIVEQRHIDELEKLCDKYGYNLPELKSFILPGGSQLASYLHISRTICRRAERAILRVFEEEGSDNQTEFIIKYVNRLSDLLFNLARWSLAIKGIEAPLWIKEQQRILK